MKHIFSLLIALLTLVGCSTSPALVSDVPTKNSFSENQLVEDGVIANGEIEKLRLNSGDFPSIKRTIIDCDLDNTWNAVLNDIAETEEIRNWYFEGLKHYEFGDFVKLVNSAEYKNTTRRWGLVEFRMANTSSFKSSENHAQIIINNSVYSPEDAIEAPTGWTGFKTNPLVSRNARIVIHFHRESTKTAVTVLNYMSYLVVVGRTIGFSVERQRLKAVSKGNIEQSILDNITNAVMKTACPDTSSGAVR